MFGLFDSPVEKIRKKTPPCLSSYFNETYLDVQINCDLGSKKINDLAHGFLMSVWAVNFVYEKYPDWDEKKLSYIFNMGNNCMRFLPEIYHENVLDILEKLTSSDIIPKSTRS